MPSDYPIKQGGHRIQPASRRPKGGEQQEWTCVDCHTTGPYGLFNIIGGDEFCPERIDSMNGYIWFNADDASVGRMRAAAQWHRHATRYGFALVDYTEVTDQPGVCATFTWREQPYRILFGKHPELGMNAPDIRVVPAEDTPEQASA